MSDKMSHKVVSGELGQDGNPGNRLTDVEVDSGGYDMKFLKSSTILDMSIYNGNGYFILVKDGCRYYSKIGDFHIGKDGFIYNNRQQSLIVFLTDEDNNITGALGPLNIASYMNMTSLEQDGHRLRLLQIEIDSEGIINGKFNNGKLQQLGQIALAAFINPQWLKKHADKDFCFEETESSGFALLGAPGTSNLGTISSGILKDVPKKLDMSINNGDGYFILNKDGHTCYSKIGDFTVREDGFICDSADQRLIGFSTNEDNYVTGVLGPLQIVSYINMTSLKQGGHRLRLLQIKIDSGGIITGKFNTGKLQPLGRIVLADFRNTKGLKKHDDKDFCFEETESSGFALLGVPGISNLGTISSDNDRRSSLKCKL